METLDLSSLVPGERLSGFLEPDLGHPVEIPYFVLRGKQSGPTLLVTAGVHGAEYASIEAANRLMRVSTGELSGTLIVLPIVNPPSFFARSIYVNPIDSKNLNRMFPGNPDGSFAERLAYWLTHKFITQADAYIDLHGGDLVEALTPFTIFQKDHRPSQTLAEVFGIDLLVESDSSVMSFTAGAAQGVPSILAEASGQGLWPEEEVERLRSGALRVMQHLGMLEGSPAPEATHLLSEVAWLSSEHSGLWYPETVVGDKVQTGQVVGQLKTLLGELLQEVVSPVNGTVLFSVSSLAINEGDPLLGIGV